MFRRRSKTFVLLCLSFVMALTVSPFSALASMPKFQTVTPTYSLPGYINDIAFADVNGDGNQDAILANSTTNEVEVWYGNGDGTLRTTPSTVYPAGDSPRGAAVADFNGDGYPDVAISNYHSDNVSILLGNGSNLVSAGTYMTGPGSGPHGITAVDLDQDGYVDLAIAANDTSRLVVLYGDGAGAFEAPVDFPVGAYPSWVITADFNRDNFPDIAVANDGNPSSDISILLNSKAGRGSQFENDKRADGGISTPTAMVSGDFNKDGWADLATADNGADGAAVLLGNGDGTFQSADHYPTGNAPIDIEMGDYDGDGNLDLAVMAQWTTTTILAGDGLGGFSAGAVYPVDGYLSSGDLNNDGLSDLAIYSPNSRNLQLRISRAEGELALSAATYSFSENAGNAVITVDRTESSYGQTKVRIRTTDGTAAAGIDYAAVEDTIAFGPGMSSMTYSIPLLDNSVRTADRTFTVTISDPTNEAELGALTSATVTIQEDDPVPDTAAPIVDASKFAAEDNYGGTPDRLAGGSGAVGESGAIVRAYPWDDADGDGAVDAGELSVSPIALGTSMADGSVAPADIGDLSPGTYKYVITATDAANNESPRTAVAALTIVLTKTRADNADLSNLTLSVGTLDPVFVPATMGYAANVANGVSSLTVTPTLADSGAMAEVRINGGAYASVASGIASSTLNLNVGANTIDVRVTAQDGTTTKTYTVTVTRAASANADLSGLELSAGTLDPAFSPGTVSYTANVSNSVSSLTVTPTLADSDATTEVWVNSDAYEAVASGIASGALHLNVGANIVDVRVTAQDGITTKTYTVTVTRATSANADLSGLELSAGTLDPAFAPGTVSYTANVANGVSSLTVTPTVADSGA
ncbi:FG-GAP-like repeat-containing protein, partial [Cohnella thailandensis]